ncbi:Pyruvate/2-oxoglutarate/acetoin dehydrogenase complex, dehydrogenase (E1) component [Streptomyces sp. Ncost-T6T-1]|uniref:2-oxo acid dehydrogenase subunit E2 n=1 Tax=Streptomyces sp. Ncost-T6T-1 TaxID=1100828 RepID=UPI0008053C7C|nr:2-oxo acid dehydrogenase subunit E2 [Streptomyces sp. Ncost-T6T-1]SBV04584.1 Pyruvate/2-oxoglutarate/acetoin dehydrogenase complex, dehydrogenase (E1) component [Streptomyces sp. Ncost-T6T-1]
MTTVAVGTVAPRVAEHLNRALHTLFRNEERLHLLGEDVSDPYGGAFKITKGLSTGFPDRVLSTPLSEGGILGVAGGLALAGDKAIVEIMFGDFIALGFDQVLNFASKSVSMYGREVPVPLVVRCPVGGNRGYGPTHSQSPQKHFVGIPNLALYELSPYHDAGAVLGSALKQGVPAVFFEDKVLYTRRMYRDGRAGDGYRYEMLGTADSGWAHTFPEGERATADVIVIAPGGMVHRALDAARALRDEHGRSVHLLTPSRLYPLDLEPVLPLLAGAGRIAVVEEGTAGGTWGAEVARLLYERIWSSLTGPVILLNSADSIIPTAPHLESRVLLGRDHIEAAVRTSAGWDVPPQGAAGEQAASGVRLTDEALEGVALTVPKLNNNDTSYLVVEWLVEDGAWVDEDADVVSLETSKAVEDITAPASGYLQRIVPEGEEPGVGALLARLLPQPPGQAAPAPRAAAPDVVPATGIPGPAAVHTLDRAQQGTAAVVAKSHREVPAGFTVIRADVDAALDALGRLEEETGAAFGLPETVIKAVAAGYEEFPLFFGSLVDERTVAVADAPHVGVTVDVGGGLYVPVVRDVAERSLADIADTLMDFRMKALTQDFSAAELNGGAISVSLNPDPGVVLVHPIVLWPQLCMVSMGAVGEEYRAGQDGTPTPVRTVHLGLAYDHRVINGRDAVLFLTRIKARLEQPDELRTLLEDGSDRP